MTHRKLSHGAWVFVSDGRKAPFLIDEVTRNFPICAACLRRNWRGVHSVAIRAGTPEEVH